MPVSGTDVWCGAIPPDVGDATFRLGHAGEGGERRVGEWGGIGAGVGWGGKGIRVGERGASTVGLKYLIWLPKRV